MIVLDASVLANAIADDGPDGHRARSELRAAGELAAADLIDVDATSVLRNRWIAGTINEERFALAIEDLGDLSIDRYRTLSLMPCAYEMRANVTAYAAAYLAIAEVLDCELLTGDRRLETRPARVARSDF